MWFKVKVSRNIIDNKGKEKTKVEYYLSDKDNFAEAGYSIMEHLNGQCEIEDVCLMKNFKPLGNEKYNDQNKVFIVKFAEDFIQEDGSTKTMKYPVPFYATTSNELNSIVELYMKQGLQDMRITTISETKWEII